MASNRLQAALAQSPYREMQSSLVGQHNPLRFFRGSAPTIEDLRAGWGILRTIRVGSSYQSFEAFATSFCEATEVTIYVLRANTGEGKTTFLRQMAWHLESEKRLVLLWSDFTAHKPELIRDLQSSGYQVVMLAELSPGGNSEMLSRIGARLAAHPLPCPLLVCGSPNEIVRAEFREAMPIQFGPLTNANIDALIKQLRAAYTMFGSTIGLTDVPQLPLYLSQPDPAVFSSSSLFVGLLQATYGIDFRQRLADEYRRLEQHGTVAQDVYGLICYCHAVGIHVPISILEQTLGKAAVSNVLYRFQDGDPWEVVDDRVKARHQIIAQTVLSEAHLLRAAHFKDFLELLWDESKPNVAYVEFVGEVLRGYASWTRLDDENSTHERGLMRRVIRDALASAKEWTVNAQKSVTNTKSYFVAASWSALMYDLLPGDVRDPSARPSINNLLALQRSWLDVAEPLAFLGARDKIAYWRSKSELISADINGGSDEIVERALRRWRGLLMRNEPLGVGFYVDLMSLAGKYASSLNSREHLYGWFEVAEVAAERASSMSERIQRSIEQAHTKILRNARGRLETTSMISLLRSGWLESVRLGNPNPRTGSWLAGLLFATGDNSDDAEAQRILRKILASVVWGEALYLLAKHCGQDKLTQDFILEYVDIRRANLSALPPLSGALMLQAYAMIFRQRNEKERELAAVEAACGAYELAAQLSLKAMWQGFGSDWKLATVRLHELSSATADSAARAWQEAARKADSMTLN